MSKKNVQGKLYLAAKTALVNCLGLRPRETVLILTDSLKRNVALPFRQVAEDIGSEVIMAEMVRRKYPGEEPPAQIAAILAAVDVALCATSVSMSFTDARKSASEKGTRMALMPGISDSILLRGMSADYRNIMRRTCKLQRLMKGAKAIRVKTKAGTDVLLPIKGRRIYADTGLIQEKGAYGNLPAGEVCVAPIEGLSEGVVVVEATIGHMGQVTRPVRLMVKAGTAVEISGGASAKRLRQMLKPHGRNAYNVAEIGIGTNDRARISGNILEDEKVMGTVHIALGDNARGLGGKVFAGTHLDCLITKPSVWFDRVQIMKEGRFLISIC